MFYIIPGFIATSGPSIPFTVLLSELPAQLNSLGTNSLLSLLAEQLHTACNHNSALLLKSVYVATTLKYWVTVQSFVHTACPPNKNLSLSQLAIICLQHTQMWPLIILGDRVHLWHSLGWHCSYGHKCSLLCVYPDIQDSVYPLKSLLIRARRSLCRTRAPCPSSWGSYNAAISDSFLRLQAPCTGYFPFNLYNLFTRWYEAILYYMALKLCIS